jgi:hypothetical protein
MIEGKELLEGIPVTTPQAGSTGLIVSEEYALFRAYVQKFCWKWNAVQSTSDVQIHQVAR